MNVPQFDLRGTPSSLSHWFCRSLAHTFIGVSSCLRADQVGVSPSALDPHKALTVD